MQGGGLLTIHYHALQNALMCKKDRRVDIILLQVNKTLGFLIFHSG